MAKQGTSYNVHIYVSPKGEHIVMGFCHKAKRRGKTTHWVEASQKERALLAHRIEKNNG